jgi:PhzF family phenazine biosynthesis protein
MKISLVNCFSLDSKDSGNPAAVVVGFIGEKSSKQELAKQLNMPVTVFINEIESPVPILEYFYPQCEMPLCLHGSLAAAHMLFESRHIDKLTCLTAKDNIRLVITRSNNLIQIEVAAKPAPNCLIKRDDICDMLHITEGDIDSHLPLSIFSVGSPKLLVPITNSLKLAQLTPNFSKILAWSLAQQVNGLYVYTKKDNEKWLARGFNPKTGYNEDAATGVAAAALALALQKNLTIEQGMAINKPSQIVATFNHADSIFVGGKTYLVEANLLLDKQQNYSQVYALRGFVRACNVSAVSRRQATKTTHRINGGAV